MTYRLDEYQREYYTPAVQPPLTRVSRQIRSESLPLFFGINDFVLHTESPKAEDAWKWLKCNEAYLALLKRLSLWVRYVPLANGRISRGAIGLSIYRAKKGDSWRVDGDWKWITVVRKPTELKGDANLMLGKLEELSSRLSGESAGSDEYVGMLSDLRHFYVRKKML